MSFLYSLYSTKSFGRGADIALLLLRLYVGITMMSAGIDKMPLPSWMVDQVIKMGFPFPTFFAWVACFSEFGFGLLLTLGLFTRMSSFFVGFTMAVAAFIFQNNTPIVDMHIAQHYVWSCLLFLTVGGARWSMDYWIDSRIANRKYGYSYLGPIILGALIAFNGYVEFYTEPKVEDSEPQVTSINVPGTFNNWDPSSNEMGTDDDINYSFDIVVQEEGLVEFKFTTNKSWDVNFGDNDRENTGLPISGSLEEGGQNIIFYAPALGIYEIKVNRSTQEYSINKKQ